MKKYLYILVGLVFSMPPLFAQVGEVDLQIRPRYEFRNGYKTLHSAIDDPASFISQRSRLGLTYREDKIALRLSLQNISTWGDVAGGAMANKNSTGIFEAYGSFDFNENLSIKAGRQVLSYDNERFFGEVNWTQPARTHDVMLVKIKPHNNQMLHVGLAYNNDAESLIKTAYTTDSYRAMEYLWYNYQLNPLSISLLFANVGYEFERENTMQDNIYQQTFGTYIKWTGEGYLADASFYKQSGKRIENKLDAFYASANFTYKFTPAFASGFGFEYLSGTDETNTNGRNKSFVPLFGTNHAFNGFMDYFYVGNHQNSVGLKDFYGKIGYEKPLYSFQISPHAFYSAATFLNENQEAMKSYLGTEIDFSASYKLQHNLTLNLGYSQMFGTKSLQELKGGDHSLAQNWAWLSLTFAPKVHFVF